VIDWKWRLNYEKGGLNERSYFLHFLQNSQNFFAENRPF